MDRVKQLLMIVRPVGWLVLGLGVGAMYLAIVANWRELAVIAAACLLLLALAAPFLVGRTNVEVDLRLEPERVAAGESVAAGVLVKNIAKRPAHPDHPRGAGRLLVHRYGIASLPPAAVTRSPSRSAPNTAA